MRIVIIFVARINAGGAEPWCDAAVQESARRPAKTDFVMGFFDLFRKKQDTPADTAAGAAVEAQPEQRREELNAGLERTKTGLFSKLARAVAGRSTVDAEVLDDLEEVLITSDVGVETTVKIIRRIEERVARDKYMNAAELRGILRDEIAALMEQSHASTKDFGLELPEGTPYVLMVVGVNGAGKTTTIGKLAHNFKEDGKSVLLAAADTFRAAAIDQLEIWGERSEIPVIKHEENSDPAAVVYDAVHEARKQNTDLLICDTAGRLHNKKNLMEELKKIARVIEREYPAAHREVYLVLDATTGQNALQQAKLFKEVTDITGIVLTKLDGTAKGGIVVAIKSELQIPVRYIGVGEGIHDLQKFDAAEFAGALFGREA